MEPVHTDSPNSYRSHAQNAAKGRAGAGSQPSTIDPPSPHTLRETRRRPGQSRRCALCDPECCLLADHRFCVCRLYTVAPLDHLGICNHPQEPSLAIRPHMQGGTVLVRALTLLHVTTDCACQVVSGYSIRQSSIFLFYLLRYYTGLVGGVV